MVIYYLVLMLNMNLMTMTSSYDVVDEVVVVAAVITTEGVGLDYYKQYVVISSWYTHRLPSSRYLIMIIFFD